MGATACARSQPSGTRISRPVDWQILARWIDDNLPYSSLFFFPTLWAVNINWHSARCGGWIATEPRGGGKAMKLAVQISNRTR